jgi:dTDP-4-dehydrorhamnose reductase
MTAVILGAGGMLGRALRKELPDALPLTRAELDVTDAAAIASAIGDGVSVVFNAAADTKVDDAENGPRHLSVNGEAVGALARRCAEVGARFVHVSTDYVFNGKGTRPYRETDPTDPVNAYGRGKLAGEELALKAGGSALVVRTSWIFGAGGVNFVDTILKAAESGKRELSVVADQTGRPTYATDLAAALVHLARREASGIVHFANSGEATWYELAREALRVAGFEDVIVHPCTSAQFPRPARRPAYSVLDTGLYDGLAGRRPRPWKAAVLDYVEERNGFRSLFAAADAGS